MKILVVSDTHRHNERLFEIFDKKGPFDGFIHLGDMEGGETDIEAYANCPCYMVSGNNDFFSALPSERELTIGSQKIFLTHGHYYYVTLGMEKLKRQGKKRGYDILLFGHTHHPLVEEEEGVIIANPGSLTYPRQNGRKPSYMIMEIEDDNEVNFTIHYLK